MKINPRILLSLDTTRLNSRNTSLMSQLYDYQQTILTRHFDIISFLFGKGHCKVFEMNTLG